ncbi:MAG: DUF4282 domain-containing protein [Solirubrobacteraceae bacterium]|nr:DUF4282 domain-containing protein [Solirubrobacteraceae bacterium]
MSTPPQIATRHRGFFGSLLDLSFTSLVTTRVIRLLYLLLLVLVALGLAASIVAAILTGEAASIVVAVVAAPLVALLYVICARVGLEVIVAIFRLLESSREIAFLERQKLVLMQRQAGVAPASQEPPPGGSGA